MSIQLSTGYEIGKRGLGLGYFEFRSFEFGSFGGNEGLV